MPEVTPWNSNRHKASDRKNNEGHQTGHSQVSAAALWIRTILSACSLFVLFALLNTKFGLLPAVGPLLEPYEGVWLRYVSPFEGESHGETLNFEGLLAPVDIQVDRDQIKHIFAQNDEDLYFAQGYVIASDRLWQMEFLTRAAEGRLSEIMGRRALEFDRFFVKIGLPEAAQGSAEMMMQDPLTGPALRAYAKGVNAFISTLDSDRLPLEYKMLGNRPREWTPERAALLLKMMAYNLAGFSWDIPLTRSYGKFSRNDFAELFPLDLEIPESIISKRATWNFPSRAPEPPLHPFQPSIDKLAPIPQPHPNNGSNNWAVTGRKSTTGKPILSNDIHLGLTLPSLWYEMQLSTPKMNVYGIALPGAPGIILGFNSNVAWGVTNGGTDIMDWFELRYRDEKRSEYLFDNIWRPVISREVSIPVRGEAPNTVLLRRTHLGPIVYDETDTPLNPRYARGLAIKWGALEPSNELAAFIKINRSHSTRECREALEGYNSPDQNFICADQKGDVGIWHMGRYPVRWRGQGRMVSDGSSGLYDWHGWIPRNEVPFAFNPASGFVSSANQAPTDLTYPHYLGWPFEAPFRGIRINELLRDKQKFSPEDFISMQFDTLSVSARMVLPPMLKALESAHGLTDTDKEGLKTLKNWNYRFDVDSVGAALYHAWFQRLEEQMWSHTLPDRKEYAYPPVLKTIRIIETDPDSKWFDDPTTPEKETLSQAALSAYRMALKTVAAQTGFSDPAKWKWAKYHITNFGHIGRIPGLGDRNIQAPGMEHSIYANQGDHGPAWKLVVALGSKPRAWGVYPGGQSGDPTSRHYNDFIPAWSRGEMKEIVFLSTAEEHNPRLQSTWRFEEKKK